MNILYKKISLYKKLYETYGFFSMIIILINNITFKFLKKRYLVTPIEYHKIYLNNEIIKISKSKIMNGHYKNTYFLNKSHWSKFDHASKLLGLYEEQVQDLIVNTQRKNNLKNFINIGCAEGYHALGLIKNNFFDKSICYEISEVARNILKENLKKNNIENKVKIRGEANSNQIKKDLENLTIEETLFLIDIEGNEFKLFSDNDFNFLKKGFFIIEDHNFMVRNHTLKDNFYSSIKKYFNVSIIQNGSRNPFDLNINFMNELNDDSRFLILSECRSQKMNWIFLSPKTI